LKRIQNPGGLSEILEVKFVCAREQPKPAKLATKESGGKKQ
jgi:hypothetical protein